MEEIDIDSDLNLATQYPPSPPTTTTTTTTPPPTPPRISPIPLNHTMKSEKRAEIIVENRMDIIEASKEWFRDQEDREALKARLCSFITKKGQPIPPPSMVAEIFIDNRPISDAKSIIEELEAWDLKQPMDQRGRPATQGLRLRYLLNKRRQQHLLQEGTKRENIEKESEKVENEPRKSLYNYSKFPSATLKEEVKTMVTMAVTPMDPYQFLDLIVKAGIPFPICFQYYTLITHFHRGGSGGGSGGGGVVSASASGGPFVYPCSETQLMGWMKRMKEAPLWRVEKVAYKLASIREEFVREVEAMPPPSSLAEEEEGEEEGEEEEEEDNKTLQRWQQRVTCFQYKTTFPTSTELAGTTTTTTTTTTSTTRRRDCVRPDGMFKRRSCRALRKFWMYRDRFLTISLPDRTPFLSKEKKHYCRDIDKFLVNGVTICGRRFEYLFDKGNKVWMLAPLLPNERGPDELRSVVAFINWVGDFEGVQSCKVADRIGLAFSKTFPVARLRKEDIHYIPDVVSEVVVEEQEQEQEREKEKERERERETGKGKEKEKEKGKEKEKEKRKLFIRRYNFSDGVAYFGRDIGALLQQNLPDQKHIPSAIQIRIGGVKGVVSYNPDVNGLYIRRSMVKFSSSHRVLEVCAVSSNRSKVTLNRELVQLLEALGADRDGVRVIQREVLEILLAATKSLEGALAFLSMHRHSDTVSSIIFKALVGGFSHDEPFINRILAQLQKTRLAKLRHKTHIPVSSAFYLMGILDEKGVLEEDEIYVQPRRGSPPLQGSMAVTTFPCNHPGDIRILKAVWKPELAHLPEVVVFSRKGRRPQPDKMSGHDLDGDWYWGTWHPALFPQAGELEPLDYGDYKHPAEIEVDPFPLDHRALTPEFDRVDEMRSYYAKFALMNDLGVISTRRLAIADRYGATCERAEELAMLQSRAVDARKLGKPQKCPKGPEYHVSTPYYLAPASTMPESLLPIPDPSGPTNHNRIHTSASSTELSTLSTSSRSVGGAPATLLKSLYDDASDVLRQLLLASSGDHIAIDPSLRYPGYESYMKEAGELFHAFNKELFLSIKLGTPTEDTRDSFQRTFYSNWPIGQEQQKSVDSCQGGGGGGVQECMKKASAIYMATYVKAMRESYFKSHHPSTNSPRQSSAESAVAMPRLSFPWQVCGDWLIKIKEFSSLEKAISQAGNHGLPDLGLLVSGDVAPMVSVKYCGTWRRGLPVVAPLPLTTTTTTTTTTSTAVPHTQTQQPQRPQQQQQPQQQQHYEITVDDIEEDFWMLLDEPSTTITTTTASTTRPAPSRAPSVPINNSWTRREPLDIYTDGHHVKGTDKKGYGAYCLYKGIEYRMGCPVSASFLQQEFGIAPHAMVSNPTMEMVAVAMVLKHLTVPTVIKGLTIRIHADYEGVIEWINGRWQAKKDYIIKVLNAIKIRLAQISREGGSVEIYYVKAHSGVPGNEEADHCASGRRGVVNDFPLLAQRLLL